jgi:predicted extracellular nuclease
VGATLSSPVTGPLNFRADAYQMAARDPLHVDAVQVERRVTGLVGEGPRVTVMTLNGFNLDPRVEDPAKVQDARRDVDDDLGEGRFDRLAEAVVRDARCPDVVALQEVQDGDGAELSDLVTARRTLSALTDAIRRAGGPTYRWAEVPPEAGADGGQPGGNIRNAFLHRPDRVELLEGSLRRLGEHDPAFVDSRKPLAVRLRVLGSGAELEIVNVHLASKRHQLGLFAPERPGFDPRLELRVKQVESLAPHQAARRREDGDYNVTGDLNDHQLSDPLRARVRDGSVYQTEGVPHDLRFDNNHRGWSQALMHGIVAPRQTEGRRIEYEILHANALLGSRPGRQGDKPSDHAYVVARLELAR